MKHSNVQKEIALTDEQRGYYLDAMGIQRWVLQRESDQPETDETFRLQQQIASCHACTLAKNQSGGVFGMGNLAAKLMLIIIAPEQSKKDQSDPEKNLLLAAPSVQLLEKMLQAIKVNINDVFITSLLKCIIPARYAIRSAEISACRHHLDQQIEIIQPDRLFVMGELTAQYLLGNNEKIDSLRTQQYEYAGCPVCISYSAEELLLQPENKRKAWLDLQRLQQQM